MEPDQNNNISLLISIDGKIDALKEQVYDISIVQTRIESDLKYHIKRTDLLETQVEEINKKVEPIHDAKTAFINASKIIAFIIGIVAGLAAAVEAFYTAIK
jgi:hypothetical protein